MQFFSYISGLLGKCATQIICVFFPAVWRGLQRENKDFFETYGHFVSPRPFLSKIMWD